MSSGKFRVDTKQIQRILTETIITLCKSTLDYDMELSIKGILGITLDQEDILLVDIKEIIKGEQILCKKAMADSSLYPHPEGWSPQEPPAKRARGEAARGEAARGEAARGEAARGGEEEGTDEGGESGKSTPVPPERKEPRPEGRSRRVKREPMKVVVIDDRDVLETGRGVSSDDKRSLLNPLNQSSTPGGGRGGEDYTLLGVPTRLSDTAGTSTTPGRGMTLPTRVLGTAYHSPSPGGAGHKSAFPIALGSRGGAGSGRKFITVAPTAANRPHNPSSKTSPTRTGKALTPGSSGKKNKPVKKHKCPDCSFSSDRRFNLERHMRQHTGGGVVCYHCGRAFCDDYYLKNNHLPKCPANPDSEVNQGRNPEPVDLSLGDMGELPPAVPLTPLQIVNVESMAGPSPGPEEQEGDTSQEEGAEVESPARNTRSSDHSPARKRKNSHPASLSKTKSITDLLAKRDASDAANNNNEEDAMFDPELKIKDEPLDT